MMRSFTSSRVGAAFAAFALVLASVVAPSSSLAATGDASDAIQTISKAAVRQDFGSSMLVESARKLGGVGSIELNVDGLDEGEQVSVFTFGGDLVVKAGFGNRFTVTTDQTPFSLLQAAAVLTETTEGVGFEAGQSVGLTVLVDASGSGNINNAITVLNGQFTLTEPGFIAVPLPQPVVVKQGDIYVIFTDLGTDAEDTVIPVLLEENGGIGDGRAYATLSTGTPNPSLASGYTRFADLATPVLGNCIVRGFGELAAPGDMVTGLNEPVDGSLAAPTGLSATGSGPVLLTWTAPDLPGPPTPVAVAETEANNSPTASQAVDVNVKISGTASSGDAGSPGGFGEDDVEDWFTFTLLSPTSVSVDLSGFGGTDFDLLLYPSAGPFVSDSAVAVSGEAAGVAEHIEVPVLPAGTYHVAVTAFDPDVPASTGYMCTIVAAPKVNRYNIFQGTSEGFTPGPENFFGAIPGDLTSFSVAEAPPNSYFKLTAVIGSAQSNASNGATGTPCEGGPTFTSVKAKRNGNGKITFKGASGSLTGISILINGVGFTTAPKVKGTKVTQKGPLTNGQTVAQACPAGCTVTILTTAGCSTATVP